MNQKIIIFLHIVFILTAACSPGKKASKQSPPEKSAEGSLSPEMKARILYLDANREKTLGNYDEAIRLFRESLKEKPNNASARYELARLLRLKDLPREAVVFAKDAVRLDPENPWYSLFLAELYGNLLAYPDQVKVYEDLVKKHPNKEDYHQLLARAQKRANFLDDAIKTFENIENRFGLNEEVAMEIYTLNLKRKKTDKAIAVIERLVLAYPWESRYKIILAETYIEQGNFDKARSVVDQGLEKDPGNPYLRLALSSLYDRQGNKDDAQRELMAAFIHPGLDLTSKLEILRSALMINQLFPEQKTDAQSMVQSLHETYPEDPQVIAFLVDVLISMELYGDAREMLVQLIELDSTTYEVWEQLIRLDAHSNEHETLLVHAERALQLFPNMPVLYFMKGLAQFQLKQHQESAKTLETGLKLIVDKDDLKADFYAFLGDIYQELKEYQASAKAYEAALRINPENANVLNNYSYYLSIRNEDLEKAARMAQKANELDPGRSSYQDTYGWVLYKQGLYTEAEQWIKKAIESGGNSSDIILEHYGDVLYKLQRQDEAMEYWKKAAEAGKGTVILEKKLKEVTLYE